MITTLPTLSPTGPSPLPATASLHTGAAAPPATFARKLGQAGETPPSHASKAPPRRQPAPVPEGRRPGVPRAPGEKDHIALPKEEAAFVHIKDHRDLPREDTQRPDGPIADVPLVWAAPVPILSPRGPAAAASLGGRQREPLAALSQDGAGDRAEASDDMLLAATTGTAHTPGGPVRHARHTRHDATLPPDAAHRSLPGGDAAAAAPGAGDTPLVSLPAQRVAEPPQAPPPIDAVAGGSAPAGGAPAAAPPVVEASVAATPGSPAFAAQLGARISTFVREGVEFATVQLHPADMGPVQVQIQIEGQTARVQLVAEHALTRQALEQALPALAGQMRESGFTLAGGGVFEQAPQQAPQQSHEQAAGSGPGSRHGRVADPAPAPAQIEPLAWRTRGLVDLVA